VNGTDHSSLHKLMLMWLCQENTIYKRQPDKQSEMNIKKWFQKNMKGRQSVDMNVNFSNCMGSYSIDIVIEIFSFFSFLLGVEDGSRGWTQGLYLLGRSSTSWVMLPAPPFASVIFQIGSHVLPGSQPQTVILLPMPFV
jgi:hypothetical protein